MDRETENTLLFLVGLSMAMVAAAGTYTRYVKPSVFWWLVAAAVVLIGLALSGIVGDLRREPRHHDHAEDDGHAHRPGILWLLVVPIVVTIFVVPPALGAYATSPSVVNVSADAARVRQPFPPLPAERAPLMSMRDVLKRLAQDSAGTLDGRLITLVGFTLKQNDQVALARVIITCCSADAQLARIQLAGPLAADAGAVGENTWLQVEGRILSPPLDAALPVPTMQVSSITRIDPPQNTYDY
jgi:uncharacterized repeat protein (TIGR03943 family)